MFLIFPQITKTGNITKDDNGRLCVQYVAMSVDEDLNLNIYTNRGRPTKAKKTSNLCRNKKGPNKTKEGNEV